MTLNPGQPLHLPTDGGLAATHPEPAVQPAFVGPATENQLNTFRARLIPFACWKVDNLRFDHDSSFVKPEIARELEILRQLRARHPGAVLSIFGHSEPGHPGPPAGQPKCHKLVIRRTDSIWPVKMAEICTGNANRYKDLEAVSENKKFLKPDGQWRDLYAGNEIHLPSDWEKAPGWDELRKDYDVQEVKDFSSGTPVRDDEYCKAISGRRAASIYALLIRRTDIWEDIYSNDGKYTSAVKGDPWGAPVLQIMLATLVRTEETTSYEQSAGKRSQLFRAYMDKLCGSSPRKFKLIIEPKDSIWPAKLAEICTGDAKRYKELEPHNEHLMNAPGQWRELHAKDEIHLPPSWRREQREPARKHYTIEPPESDSNDGKDGLELTKEDFLARGRDPHGKGDYQGCGAFNPVLATSDGEGRKLSDLEQLKEDALNRRVMVLLYHSGSRVDPTIWPCPRVNEGSASCRKRFWSQSEPPRSQRMPESIRGHEETRLTAACRFYDRMASASPCEQHQGAGIFYMQCFAGDGESTLAGRRYRIHGVGSPIRFTGVLDETGTLRHTNVPAGNYVLSVHACSEDSPITVLRADETARQIRLLENGRLAITVETPAGDPIADSKVTVDGLGERLTDEDGIAYFGSVPEGEFGYAVSKPGFYPTGEPGDIRFDLAGGSTEDGQHTGRVIVKDALTEVAVTLEAKAPAKAPQISRITGRQDGTHGKRDSQKSFGENSLPSSQPVVLVRGGSPIFLKAITDPPGQTVTWDVVRDPPLQSSALPLDFKPKQTSGNSELEISLDAVEGAYRVTATMGKSVLVWNFILVSVEVDPKSSISVVGGNFMDFNEFLQTPDGKRSGVLPGSPSYLPSSQVGVSSGAFETGKYAWESKIEVNLKGGGPSGHFGCDRVVVRVVQNVEHDRTVGEYRSKKATYDSSQFPMLDTSPGSPTGYDGPSAEGGILHGVAVRQSPFLHSPGMFQDNSDLAKDPTKRFLNVGDSPAANFDETVGSPGEKLLRVSGVARFRTAVVSYSKDSKSAIVLHAMTIWEVDYSGVVKEENGRLKWTKQGAWVTPNVGGWIPVQSARGLIGTHEVNKWFELFKPLALTLNGPGQRQVS